MQLNPTVLYVEDNYENRILVQHGLQTLRADPLPGLAELMKITKLDQVSTLDTENIAFTLAPRLNAAGRLGQAQLAVELLRLAKAISPRRKNISTGKYLPTLGF